MLPVLGIRASLYFLSNFQHTSFQHFLTSLLTFHTKVRNFTGVVEAVEFNGKGPRLNVNKTALKPKEKSLVAGKKVAMIVALWQHWCQESVFKRSQDSMWWRDLAPLPLRATAMSIHGCLFDHLSVQISTLKHHHWPVKKICKNQAESFEEH